MKKNTTGVISRAFHASASLGWEFPYLEYRSLFLVKSRRPIVIIINTLKGTSLTSSVAWNWIKKYAEGLWTIILPCFLGYQPMGSVFHQLCRAPWIRVRMTEEMKGWYSQRIPEVFFMRISRAFPNKKKKSLNKVAQNPIGFFFILSFAGNKKKF